MKLLTHFIGQDSKPLDTPHGCRWVRVRDFDSVGIVQPLTFPVMYGLPVQEVPTVAIDEGGAVPIYSLNQVFRADANKPIRKVTLTGNIEVEMGESGDSLLESLLYGRWRSDYIFDDRNGSGIPNDAASLGTLPGGLTRQLIVPLPKGTETVQIECVSLDQRLATLATYFAWPILAKNPTTPNSRKSQWFPGNAVPLSALDASSIVCPFNAVTMPGIAIYGGSDTPVSCGGATTLGMTYTRHGTYGDFSSIASPDQTASNNRFYRPLPDVPLLWIVLAYNGNPLVGPTPMQVVSLSISGRY